MTQLAAPGKSPDALRVGELQWFGFTRAWTIC